jgi:hypothetical protein
MSESKKRITELHIKAAQEKKAKEEMYSIAVNSIKAYQAGLNKAGKLVDWFIQVTIKHRIDDDIFIKGVLAKYIAFIVDESMRNITFKEYIERRKSNKYIRWMIVRFFSVPYKKVFKTQEEQYNSSTANNNFRMEVRNGFQKEFQTQVKKFHIMLDILSDTKKTEDAMLLEYGLNKSELMSIIAEIQKELKGGIQIQ